MWRTIFRQWAQNMAAEAVENQLAQAKETTVEPTEARADVAVMCALAMESGGLEDRLENKVWLKTAIGKVCLGEAGSVRVALATSGPGGVRAAQATEAVVLGHRPRLVVAAGFAGGLVEELRRFHVFFPNEVVDTTGRAMGLPPAVAEPEVSAGIHVGRLLSVAEPVRTPEKKRELAARCGALAVDLETFSVAEVCRRQGVPMAAIRVITDTVDEVLPPEVAYLMQPRKWTEKMGAVVGAIWHRPGSLKDMWRLQEVALRAGDILAQQVLGLLRVWAAVGSSSE